MHYPQNTHQQSRREMFFSFNHLHKHFVPAYEEPEEFEEPKPRKREPWRKFASLPDYRKLKNGEYFEGTSERSSPTDSSNTTSEDGSEGSPRSSFESDSTIESDESTKRTTTRSLCSGCRSEFAPAPVSVPSCDDISSYEIAKCQQSPSGRKKLRVHTKHTEPTRFRCMWPGCRVVLCSACSALMKVPKTSGGIGGSLKDLQEYWDLQKKVERQSNSPGANVTRREEKTTHTQHHHNHHKSRKADGAVTADIVQAVTSSVPNQGSTKATDDAKKTMDAVDRAVAVVTSKPTERNKPKFIPTQHEELRAKFESVRVQNELSNSHKGTREVVDAPSGIFVVTVKEVGLVEEP